MELMSHTPDYLDAHNRHWEDAELLFNRNRQATADHLYGISSECGLKAMMEIPVDESGRPREREHQVHIDRFWSVFTTFLNGQGGGRFLSQFSDNNPFADWSVHDRYSHRDHIAIEQLETHREAARKIRTSVQLFALDGQL